MLIPLINEIKINRRILRQFAWIMAAMLGLAVPFVIIWFNEWEVVRAAWIVSVIGVVFLFAGILTPMLLRPVYIFWMLLALALGTVVTRVIITIVFYLMITPTGWIRRTFATRDPLGLRPDPRLKTYWITKKEASPDQIKKQY